VGSEDAADKRAFGPNSGTLPKTDPRLALKTSCPRRSRRSSRLWPAVFLSVASSVMTICPLVFDRFPTAPKPGKSPRRRPWWTADHPGGRAWSQVAPFPTTPSPSLTHLAVRVILFNEQSDPIQGVSFVMPKLREVRTTGSRWTRLRLLSQPVGRIVTVSSSAGDPPDWVRSVAGIILPSTNSPSRTQASFC